MDPSRHHDFIANNDDRTNRNSYYGREMPEIASHHYYGPTTTTRTVTSNTTRKPCGCTTTGNGTTAGGITCNGCRLNSTDEGGWSTMANPNQMEHTQQQRGAIGAIGDYHHRMASETTATVRTSMRQSPMYMQQQHHHQQAPPTAQNATHMPQPPSLVQHTTQQHPAHVGSMPGSRITSYWPQSSSTSSSSTTMGQPYPGDEHIRALPTQPTHSDSISVTRRNAPTTNEYGQYKSSTTMPPNVTHPAHTHSSNSGIGGGSSRNNIISGSSYPLPSTSSSMPVHQRVSTIGAAGLGGSGVNTAGSVPTNATSPYMSKERIYEQHKYSPYSSTAAGATAKIPYNTTPSSAIYDSHHYLNNQAISKTVPVDHHVINPSNLPASKDQHPSPNYARKCPQMYTPEEQNTAHQHLYMSTPQFSSDKFTRASPQQPPPGDFTKLRESPSGSAAYMVAPHSEKYSPHLHSSSHLRESPQFVTHTTSPAQNPSSYYNTNQTPSKILPPEMSPIIMKQSHQSHYQYSKSPLPPPLPPSHLQQQQHQHQHQTIPPTSQMAAKTQTAASLGAPPPSSSSTALIAGSTQRGGYIMDNVKREDLEIYESSHQTPTRSTAGSGGGVSGGIYINPFNTPPPTSDNCCKEVALSNSSSPYTTGSATPNYRVESPQFYPTKYGKLAMTENLSSSKHSLINQNTPPPSRAPSQRGQHQANYYYEGNSHSAPSPAAATAASPSPSAILTTTSQTPIHHSDYITPGIGPPPAPMTGHSTVPNMPQTYTTQPPSTAQSHHYHQHHQPASAAMRNNDLMITAVQPSSTHPYERSIQHSQAHAPSAPAPAPVPVAPPMSQHLSTKHVLPHPSSNAPAISTFQMSANNTNPNKTASKHQKPNYRELINQKLAMRNATSEEELNLQIIKKTLNVDTQNIRAPPANSSQLPLTTSSRTSMPALPTPAIRGLGPAGDSLTTTKHTASVLVTHNTAQPMSSTTRIVDVTEAIPQRICIKQEDDKPSSSTGSSTTSSSPLDLSMRTVKTKADSTEYKYQQKPRLLPAAASSTTPSEGGRYTLPRVDSTPIFSVHAFEPGAANAVTAPQPSRQSTTPVTNSRHNSLDRRNYTPPTQAQIPLGGGSPYPPSNTQYIPPASPSYQYGGNSSTPSRKRDDLTNNMPQQSSHAMGCYENSLVIKSAPKLKNLNSDLVVRPSTITAPPAASTGQNCRPSVVETNPYATVIKTETKRLHVTPPASPHHTLAAVERLPPDTSIMALPARNPYGVVRSAIQSNHNANISTTERSPPAPPSNYTLACEKNPNFLGRKRHLQEYSNQMALNEPLAKQNRFTGDSPPQTAQLSNPKPQLAMRPADISVIAVNDVQQLENFERKSKVVVPNKPTTVTATTTTTISSRPADKVSTVNSTGVIASTVGMNSSKVIVNNVNVNLNSHSTSPALVVCKQEPLTPTIDKPPALNSKPADLPMNASTARIRTKAELKGFTFNPPPPLPIQTAEINNSPPSPPKEDKIKQEEDTEMISSEDTAIKIKEEIEAEAKVEMPTIPGLNDEFEENNLLDFGWNSTCNNLMEQLLTRPPVTSNNRKKTSVMSSPTLKKLLKDSDMMVTSSEAVLTTKNIFESNHFATIASEDNTTRSSFNRLDGGIESSSINYNNLNQDSINSQQSGVIYKKLTKTEREKKRFQQEQRLAERLKAKESSSETEDELDKRKTERLKKPLMKTKHKIKSPKSNTNSSSSSNSLTDKNRFSDCGSDSTSSSGRESDIPKTKEKSSPIKIEIKQEKLDDQDEQMKEEEEEEEKKDTHTLEKDKKEKLKIKEFERLCVANIKKEPEEKPKEQQDQQQQQIIIKKSTSNNNNNNNNSNKTKEIRISLKKDKSIDARDHRHQQQSSKKFQQVSSDDEEDEEEEEQEQAQAQDEEEDDDNDNDSSNKTNSSSPSAKEKCSLNTMTRSKRKKELEQQLANSKVLRNDKIIRNSSSTSTSSNKIKRKYNRKYNTINSILETGGLSRESGIMKSTRLKAKLERNASKLNLLKNNNKNIKTNNKLVNSSNQVSKESGGGLSKLKNDKPENVHERNVIDLYRFKRALKVPPSLISIKHPGAHKIAASLPDLERHAEALEAFAKKQNKHSPKNKSKSNAAKAKSSLDTKNQLNLKDDSEEPKSIIDLLHSRVTKASAMNVRSKTTTTTAVYRTTKPCCTTTSNNSKLSVNNSNNNNNCGMFSETSQTTESSELQMLPELKKDSEDDDDHIDIDNDTANGGKKRHFSIFETKVLPTKTRTESKLQQKKENIREIFVGDDRPASAPPEITQSLDCSTEKMTYEQKYEQFLQQMNIVISADKLGRLNRSSANKKLPMSSTLNGGNQDTTHNSLKQEEGDTESTSVIDADELKEDQKSSVINNHLRKRRNKYLRRKGSSGFDYIRKKKKPTSNSAANNMNVNNNGNGGPLFNLPQFSSLKAEKFEIDEYENKVKTEDDVSREIQKWVLNKGVGQSSMHKAARLGYIDVIVYCLDRIGMNPDQKDNAGYTPLHEACTNGWLNIARVLLQYGANHSEAAHSGIRPLHEASENDHEEIVRLLLSYGADPLLATYSGEYFVIVLRFTF